MSTDRTLAILEFSLWVLAATAIVVAVAFPLGLLVGGDLIAGKTALFVAGFLLFGAGSIAIQPEGPDLEGSIYDPDRDGAGEGTGDDEGRTGGRRPTVLSMFGGGSQPTEETGVTAEDRRTGDSRFEARIRAVGPLANHHLPAEKRIGRSFKIFATGILVLAVSFLLEVGGVRV